MKKRRSKSFQRAPITNIQINTKNTFNLKQKSNSKNRKPFDLVTPINKPKNIKKISTEKPKSNKNTNKHSSKKNTFKPPKPIIKTQRKKSNLLKSKHDSPAKSSGNRKRKDKQHLADSEVKPSLFHNDDSPQHHQFQTQQIRGLLAKSFQNNIKVKKMPSQVQKLVDVGKGFLKDNNLQSAIDCFAKARQLQKDCFMNNYLLALTFMTCGRFQKASEIFEQVLQKNINKNIYLLAAVCYKKMGSLNNMDYILNKCIQNFPKYYEAYIYRAKMKIKMKNIYQAAQDFQTAIRIDHTKLIGLIGRADCFRLLSKHQQAIQLYNQIIHKNNSISLMLKRSLSYIQSGMFQQALIDIQYILRVQQSNSEAYFFKGLIFHKKSMLIQLENYNDAIICYEQAIKYNSNKKAITKSIYQIAKIKIQQKDYYQAFYTLCRVQYLDVQQKTLQKFRIFTDGVTFIMKRKQKQGLNLLCKLQKQYSIGDFIKPLLLSIRAYGYMCVGKYQLGLNDLNRLQKQIPLDLSSLYNKYICQGVISCNSNKFQNALTLFSKASKVIPIKMEPYFYKAMTLISFAHKMIPVLDEQKRKQYMLNALKNIQKGFAINNSSASLSFHRGLLKLFIGNKKQALNDIDFALKKCQQPLPKFYFIRGYFQIIRLINATTKKYIDAINDFSEVIRMDFKKQFPQSYLNRAKCFIMYGDKNKAFNDLQDYMLINPSDPNIHMWAGNLLFSIGAYQDALKAYGNISNINKNGKNIQQVKILNLRARTYLSLKIFNKALNDLSRILEIQNSQTIRFDLQMINAIKISLISNEASFKQALKKISQAKKTLPIAGQIFDYADYFFFKGVFYFYLQQYNKAAKNIQKSRKIRVMNIQAMKQARIQNIQTYRLQNMQFENRTYNIYEYHFNIAICAIMNCDYSLAINQLKALVKQIKQEGIVQNLKFFIQYLQQQKNESLINKKNKVIDQQDLEEPAVFILFPSENRLCSYYSQIKLKNISQAVTSRLSFNFPRIDGPNMVPQVQQKFIEQIGMNSVQSKPQAPWIRRNNDGVIFTDEIQYIELDLSSEDVKEQNSDFDYDQQYQFLTRNGVTYGSGNLDSKKEQQGMIDREHIRKFLKLDDGIEQKISKLCNK